MLAFRGNCEPVRASGLPVPTGTLAASAPAVAEPAGGPAAAVSDPAPPVSIPSAMFRVGSGQMCCAEFLADGWDHEKVFLRNLDVGIFLICLFVIVQLWDNINAELCSENEGIV